MSFFNLLSAVWGGAKLADVLELVGIPKLTSSTKSGGKHVEFVSVDRCKVHLLPSHYCSEFFLNLMIISL